MAARDKRVDAYIARAQPFAQPILTHIRDLVHRGCPDVEETIKWGIPYFDYKGMMCGMAAFKAHCAMGFWKAALLPDPGKRLETGDKTSAMGHLGRISTLKDLPPDRVLLGFIRKAAALNDEGIRQPARTRPAQARPVRVPPFLAAALKEHPAAFRTFQNFPQGHKREYIEWLTEAKTAETRRRRLETAIAWMEEGKQRNWKYMSKK